MIELWVRKPVVAAWKASAEKGERRTDESIAAALRLGINTVSRYINRAVPIPYAAARLLADTMGVPFTSLIEERLTPPPQPRPHPAVTAAEVARGAQPVRREQIEKAV